MNSCGLCDQCTLFEAANQPDMSWLKYAFEVICSSEGHHEAYGGSIGGAAFCYIVRLGSDSDIIQLRSIIEANKGFIGQWLEAAWEEYPRAHELIVFMFIHGQPDQRNDFLEILDIKYSEGESFSRLVDELKATGLTGKEAKALQRTVTGNHYA